VHEVVGSEPGDLCENLPLSTSNFTMILTALDLVPLSPPDVKETDSSSATEPKIVLPATLFLYNRKAIYRLSQAAWGAYISHHT
jgi:hypothetical protein